MSALPVTSEQTEFFVSRGGLNLGPWTMSEIVDRLGTSELNVTDFIFDEGRGEWIPFLECAPLVEALKAQKPKAPPPRAAKANLRLVTSEDVAPEPAATQSTEPCEWYVQKGSQRIGPLTYRALVRQLQERSITANDMVWKEGMEQWAAISQVEDFSTSKIRELHLSSNANDAFFQRRYMRVPYESEVHVHDHRHVWSAQCVDLGESGAGLIIDNPRLAVGQVLNMHFASKDLPAFNAICEIVSKRPIEGSGARAASRGPFVYGVKFMQIDAKASETLREYFRVKPVS
jgi:hypothetical protein